VSHSNLKALAFLVLFVSALGAAAVAFFRVGQHDNWVTLNDPRAGSVAAATDLDAYRILLWAHPSLTWQNYYQQITEEGLGLVNGDVQVLRQMRAAARIIELPNGTRAEQEDQIVLTEPDNPLHRTAFQAFKVRVRAGPHNGLEAWTAPDLIKHEGPPPLPSKANGYLPSSPCVSSMRVPTGSMIKAILSPIAGTSRNGMSNVIPPAVSFLQNASRSLISKPM
jgi:hypothetical protein